MADFKIPDSTPSLSRGRAGRTALSSWRITRSGAGIGLLTVLVLVPFLLLLIAAHDYRVGTAAKKANDISDAYQQARYSVGAEESLEIKYRLEPGTDVRTRHANAAGELVTALTRIESLDPNEASAVDDLLQQHAFYLGAIDRLFAAVDTGKPDEVNRIDVAEADPTFHAIEAAVSGKASQHRADAMRQLDRLIMAERLLLISLPLVLGSGLALAVYFIAVLGRSRRQADEAVTAAMRRSEQRFRALVRYAADAVVICDSAGKVLYQAPTAAGMTRRISLVAGSQLAELVHADDRAALQAVWHQISAAAEGSTTVDVRTGTPDGQWRDSELILTNLLHDDAVHGVVVNVRDVTERKAFVQQLETQAFYDSLTGLPNRALLIDRISQAGARAASQRGVIGLLFVDLDNFKRVNDSLGHHAGDALLKAVARRLESCVRPTDTVARLGGDEFVILLDQLPEKSDLEANQFAQRIITDLSLPFPLKGGDYVISASVGIALGREFEGRSDGEALLRDADVAMYRAKAGGKGRSVMFNASMHAEIVSRLELERELRHALKRGELRVFFQPIISLDTGAFTGAEALVRWEHPVKGLISPKEFIPVAEDSGLIVPLGLWVLEEACCQTMAWQHAFPSDRPVQASVNLSPRQFEHPNLLEDVQRIVDRCGLGPGNLALEVTEGMIMRDPDASIRTLSQLKDLGIRLAIDDFGTGYSSLSYLKTLPVDAIKIDRSFIDGIGENEEDDAIVLAVIAMARSLDLQIVAEGVENRRQDGLLRTWGCDRAQGYLYARPCTAAEITDMLDKDRRRLGGDPSKAKDVRA